jgi:ATP-dependent exoDNAse (exonuclease V) beta subunit
MRVLVKPDSRLDKYEALYLFFRMILQRIPAGDDNQHIKTAVESQDINAFYAYVNNLAVGTVLDNLQFSTSNEPAESEAPLNPYKLLQISAYELAEKLIQAFRLFEQIKERDYLFRFLDVVLEFSTQRGSHLADFLDYWETQKEKISISAPSDPQAITVQTIHRSKGLEYPVVIIPYADWEFVPSAKRDTMWVNLDPTDDLGIVFEGQSTDSDALKLPPETKWLKTGSVQVKSDLERTTKSVAAQYQEERERVFVENLNLLYVAFTRPTRKLYVLAKEEDFAKVKNPKKVSYWLYHYWEGNEVQSGAGGLAIVDRQTRSQFSPRSRTDRLSFLHPPDYFCRPQ